MQRRVSSRWSEDGCILLLGRRAPLLSTTLLTPFHTCVEPAAGSQPLPGLHTPVDEVVHWLHSEPAVPQLETHSEKRAS
jgi:hypothetical protein